LTINRVLFIVLLESTPIYAVVIRRFSFNNHKERRSICKCMIQFLKYINVNCEKNQDGTKAGELQHSTCF